MSQFFDSTYKVLRNFTVDYLELQQKLGILLRNEALFVFVAKSLIESEKTLWFLQLRVFYGHHRLTWHGIINIKLLTHHWVALHKKHVWALWPLDMWFKLFDVAGPLVVSLFALEVLVEVFELKLLRIHVVFLLVSKLHVLIIYSKRSLWATSQVFTVFV